MGYVGQAPNTAILTAADITDGIIANADIASDAAIALSKTALSAGTGLTLSTNTLNVDASQAGITTVGTIGTGAWQGTPVTSSYINASQTGITSVGALNAGSITSGFTSIDVGAGGITTTGAIAGGTIDATTDFTVGTTVITDDTITFGAAGSIDYAGNLYFTGTLATASNTNNYMVRFNEADSSVTASAANSGTGISGYGFVVIDGEAIAAASSLTFAESSSLMITGPPTAGTNMTLTKAFALNVVAGNVSMAATAKLYLDGGVDTYLYEKSGNNLAVVANSVELVVFNGAGQTEFSRQVAMSGNSLYFDNGSNTRIYEESDDDLHIVVGGVSMIEIDQDLGTGIVSIGTHGVNDFHKIRLGGNFTSGGSDSSSAIVNVGGVLTGAGGDTNFLTGANFDIATATQTATESIALITQVRIGEPIITDNLTGDITLASSLAVVTVPTEGEFNAHILVGQGQNGVIAADHNLVLHADPQAGQGSSEIRFNVDSSQVGFIGAAGLMMLGETANANMTIGLTINQASTDDEILAFKSSDVSHGMTDTVETDTFGSFKKQQPGASGGGLRISGYSDVNTYKALVLEAFSADATPGTTDTSNSAGVMEFNAGVISGTDITNVPDTANAFVFGTSDLSDAATRMVIKGSGTVHVTDTTLVALDDQPDALVVRAMQKASSHSGIVESEYDNPFYDGAWLRERGLLGEGAPGEALFPIQNRFAAHEGAIWQNYTSHMSLVDEVESLRGRLASAEQQLQALEAH